MLKTLRKMLVRNRATSTSVSARSSIVARRFIPRLGYLEDRLVPATILVTTLADVVNSGDGVVSLREAITTANATAAPDTIQLKAGIYRISLAGGGENANASGDFDISNSTTIIGVGSQSTYIDGGRLDRVFHVVGTAPSSIASKFRDMTIRNGRCTDGGGGGILIGNADLAVTDCIITGNEGFPGGGGISNFGHSGTGTATLTRTTVSRNIASAGNGGGIDLTGSTLNLVSSALRRNVTGEPGDDTDGGYGGGFYALNANLTDSFVVGNTAFKSGGGFYATNSATLTNSKVNGNTARNEGGGMYVFNIASLTGCQVSGNAALGATGFGGGVVTTNAFLTRCTVTGNSATNGAGVATTTGSIRATTISGNHASGDGGGLYSVTSANVINSTVSENFAARGAGVYATTAILSNSTLNNNVAFGNGGGAFANTVNLSNATISGNSAGTSGIGTGGGIYAAHGTILNSTIVENFAAGGGGGVAGSGAASPIAVKNTIIALNLTLPISSGPDVNGTFASLGHNLIGVNLGSNGFGAVGDLVGTGTEPRDPKLGALQNNGGPTATHALLKGSSAIDRGNNSGAPSTDQRGVARPRDGDGNTSAIVDIGAFEK